MYKISVVKSTTFLHIYLSCMVTGPVHLCDFSTLQQTYIPAAILPLAIYGRPTYCHICSTRYPFTCEWIKSCERNVSCSKENKIKTMSQLWVVRHMILWKPALSGDLTSTTGSGNFKSPRSNHSATSLSKYENTNTKLCLCDVITISYGVFTTASHVHNHPHINIQSNFFSTY